MPLETMEGHESATTVILGSRTPRYCSHLRYCMTLGKLLPLHVPHFPHLGNGEKIQPMARRRVSGVEM